MQCAVLAIGLCDPRHRVNYLGVYQWIYSKGPRWNAELRSCAKTAWSDVLLWPPVVDPVHLSQCKSGAESVMWT
jgi:hypothetical protein